MTFLEKAVALTGLMVASFGAGVLRDATAFAIVVATMIACMIYDGRAGK